MPKEIVSRVFIVGCPRSGTTLLQSMLAAHPDIGSFPETHFFLGLTGQIPFHIFGARPAGIRSIIQELIADIRIFFGIASPLFRGRVNNLIDNLGCPGYRRTYPWKGRSMREKTDAFVDILDKVTLGKGKRHWVEKSPHHLSYIPLIEKYVQHPRFIHVVRGAEDNITSIYELVKKYPEWGNRYGHSLEACVRQWELAISISEKYIDKPRHHLVRFERLLDRPERELCSICDFMNVEYSPAMLENHSGKAGELVLGYEEWKKKVFGPLDRKSAGRHREGLTESERDLVCRRLEGFKMPDFAV